MGVVFKARQLSMDRVVALKVLPKRLARNEAFVARFVAEARAAGKLNHANIVQVHDVGNDGDTYFFSMEFIDGGTAFEIMQENGPFSESEAIDIGAQIARGLEAAHSRGIVHRDVKPDNLMIDHKGTAKLADLGLARVGPGEEDEVGQAYGTPYYMSPEQAKGQSADARSDLYSLGASLYHMVANRTPFEGATPAAVMAKHVSEELEPLTRAANVSREFAAVVAKLMRKDPAQRYQHAAEAVHALEKLKHGSATRELAGKSRASVHRRRVVPRASGGAAQAVAGVIAALVIAGGAYVFFARRRSPDVNTVSRETKSHKEQGPSREEQARLKFNAVSDWARRSPDSLAEVASRFEDFAKEFPASPLAEEARAKAHKARDELRLSELVKRFQEAKERAGSLVSRGAFGNAVKELEDFARSAPREDIASSARAEAADVKRKAQAAFEKLMDAAKSLEAKGKHSAARRELEKAALLGMDRLTARAREEMAALARRKEEAARGKEEEALASALAKAAELVSGRRFGDAAAGLETAVRKLSGQRKERARERADDLKLMANVWKEALARLSAKKVPLVRIGLKEQGSAVGAGERGVEIGKGRGTAVRTWTQFSPENVFRLAQQALRARDGMEHLGLAALAIELEQIEAADSHLRSAAGAGVAGETYSRYRRFVDGKLAEAREASAKALFERAKEAPRLHRKAMARKLLGDYAETGFVRKHRKEIDALGAAKKGGKEKEEAAGPDATRDLARLGWQVVKGKWTVKGKNTFLGTEAPVVLQAGDATWANEAVQLRVQIIKGEECSIVVRYDANLVSEVEQIMQTLGGDPGGGGGRGQFGAWRQALIGSLAAFPGYGVKIAGNTVRAFDAGRSPAGWRGATGPWAENASRLPNMVAERKILRGGACDIVVSVEGDKLEIWLNKLRMHSDTRPKRSAGPVVIEAPAEVELLLQNPRVRNIK